MHRHELSNEQWERLCGLLPPEKPNTGRPRLRPGRVVGDKGYSHRRLREHARRRGIRLTFPRRVDQARTGPFDRSIYRTRNLVERLINRCKQFRRIATRYEKKAEDYRAMWTIAAILDLAIAFENTP